MRAAFGAALLAGLAIVAGTSMPSAVAATAARTEECAPRPDDPTGYEIRAVRADQVQLPAVTPPVAVLDTGVAEVPELAGRIRRGANTAGGSSTDDKDGHGTAVASVLAAEPGGVRGVSPTTPIIPITIFDSRGESSADAVATGIDRAVSLGAGVVNISAAEPPGNSDPAADLLVQGAINRAVTRGVLVVGPSGNEGISKLDIPASYAHVVAVGATDQSSDRAQFSNGGVGLDLVAPGENITAAAPKSVCATGYALVSGTSFAVPAVSGAAALLEALHPGLDSMQLIDLLRLRGQRARPPAWTTGLGFGLLDVAAALASPLPAPDTAEVNDTMAWSRRHSPVLTSSKRRAMLRAHVAPHSDPADVYRLKLKTGERLRASLAGFVSGGATLSISDGRRTLATSTTVSLPIRKTGTFYAIVTAQRTAEAGTDYSLTLRH